MNSNSYIKKNEIKYESKVNSSVHAADYSHDRLKTDDLWREITAVRLIPVRWGKGFSNIYSDMKGVCAGFVSSIGNMASSL